MNITVEQIRNEVRALPPEDREELLTVLEFDLQGGLPVNQEGADPQVITEWDAEIERRAAEAESGKAVLLTHNEFISAFTEARDEISGRATEK